MGAAQVRLLWHSMGEVYRLMMMNLFTRLFFKINPIFMKGKMHYDLVYDRPFLNIRLFENGSPRLVSGHVTRRARLPINR